MIRLIPFVLEIILNLCSKRCLFYVYWYEEWSYLLIKAQNFIGGGYNFDSDLRPNLFSITDCDSDSEKFCFGDSYSDPDSVGVGVIIGFRSSPQVPSSNPWYFSIFRILNFEFIPFELSNFELFPISVFELQSPCDITSPILTLSVSSTLPHLTTTHYITTFFRMKTLILLHIILK